VSGDSGNVHARVVFPLAQEDGWRPVGSERLWALPLGENRYRIDNVPWFVRDLAVGDVVIAKSEDRGSHPVFAELVQRSDHVTVRLICFRGGLLEGDLARRPIGARPAHSHRFCTGSRDEAPTGEQADKPPWA